MSTESMVTQADYALAEEVVSAANVVSHDGYYEVDIDAAAKTIAAWNTRAAAQPEREAVLSGVAAATQKVQHCRNELNVAIETLVDARAALTTPAPVSTDEIVAALREARPYVRLASVGGHSEPIDDAHNLCRRIDAILSRIRGEGETQASRQSAIVELCEGLEKAATWFEEYAGAHDRKMREAVDSYEQAQRADKAIRNAERAKELRALLSKHSPDAPGDERHG